MNNLPLISCIMPTRNRAAWVEQSIKYFESQTYPNKELIIIDDGDDTTGQIVTKYMQHVSIKYAHFAGHHSIGEGRNFACALAKGELICHWDDDDYYSPHRLVRQSKPILQGNAEVSAFQMNYLLNIQSLTLWECSSEEHKRLFAYDVRCGTLMYPTSYYEAGLRYKDSSRGEDVAFLKDIFTYYNARLRKLVACDDYMCVRHADNVTVDMDYINNPEWSTCKMTDHLPEEAINFYSAMNLETKHTNGK